MSGTERNGNGKGQKRKEKVMDKPVTREQVIERYNKGELKQTQAVDALVVLGGECKTIYRDLDIPYRQCYNVIHRAQYNKKPSERGK